MPVLEIKNEMLSGVSATLLANIIGAYMCWPAADENTRRVEAIKTFKAEWLREQNPDIFKPAWYELALSAYPMKEIKKWAETPLIEGPRAGVLLVCAVGDYAESGGFKFDKDGIKDEIANIHKDKLSKFGIGTGRVTLDKIWKKYKPTAHFWAAYACDVREGGDPRNFPCRIDCLAEFLSDAEAFLEAGCTALHQQSGGRALLSYDEAWTLPAALEIPRTELKFEGRPKS